MRKIFLFLALLAASVEAQGTRVFSRDFLIEVAKGNVSGHRIVHKFGHGAVTTSLAPVTLSGFYRTPIAAAALEVVSTDANDTAAGSGAQQVTIVGLDASWAEVSQTVEMNGVTAVDLTTDLIRVYRWYVSRSGTYATQSAASMAGTLTLQEDAGGDVWSVIDLVGGLGRGQSQIGAYTIPSGKDGWLLSAHRIADTAKTVDLFFFLRPNADDVTTPFTGAMRMLDEAIGVASPVDSTTRSPRFLCAGPCDVGFLASVPTTTADAAVKFELLEIDQ